MPQAREEAGVPKHPIRANGKFWGKFMLNRVPGQVPKEALDKYFEPWTCKWEEQVPERGPWISRVPAARTNHS